jgi:hypothetical protein
VPSTLKIFTSWSVSDAPQNSGRPVDISAREKRARETGGQRASARVSTARFLTGKDAANSPHVDLR